MKNILIINGHEAYPHARGQLNHTIFTAMVDKLGEKYEVKKQWWQTAIKSRRNTKNSSGLKPLFIRRLFTGSAFLLYLKNILMKFMSTGFFIKGLKTTAEAGCLPIKSICFQPHGTRRRMSSPKQGLSSKVKALMKRCFICIKCRNSSA